LSRREGQAGAERELAPEDRLAAQGEQAQDPEVAPLQRQHREDEPAREGRQDQGRDRQGEEREQVPPGGALGVVAETAGGEEGGREQAEEDQELGPLRRVAPEGPQVLEDQQADRLGDEEEAAMEHGIQAVPADPSSRRAPALDPPEGRAVQLARDD